MENKYNQGVTLIGKQYRDEDGFYVAEVNRAAFVTQSTNYEDRLQEALDLFHEVVQTTTGAFTR